MEYIYFINIGQPELSGRVKEVGYLFHPTKGEGQPTSRSVHFRLKREKGIQPGQEVQVKERDRLFLSNSFLSLFFTVRRIVGGYG